MSREEIVRKIEDFRELGILPHISRKEPLLMKELMVSTVIGARRSGKSFRVMQAARELIAGKVIASIRHICHLDFDNPVLATMTAVDLMAIPSIFLSVTPDANLKTPLLFIFDELHVINGWELFVVELSRNPHWKVIVTGSSSRLLHKEIATELRGKALPSVQYPLSFSEFLDFKGIPRKFSTVGTAAIRRAFDEFLQWGSYPAIPQTAEHLRAPLLREYFDTMVLRDIIQRYNISKPRQCIELFHYLLSTIGKPFTTVSAHNFLKTTGAAIGREAVTEWIHHAQDSWLYFAIPFFSDSLKTQELHYKKLYAIDWALAHCNSRIWDGSLSRSLENAVYIHLARSFPRVNYYSTRSKHQEVDFIVTNQQGTPVKMVQVCLDISDPDTLKREMAPLVESAAYFKTRDNLILTLDQENRIEHNGITIRVVPAWKWFLEE